MEKTKFDKSQELKNLAINKLIAALEDDKNTEVSEKTKLALGSLSAISRSIATDRVKDATQFHIIKEITNDPKTRAEYIRATLPQYIPKKVIEESN